MITRVSIRESVPASLLALRVIERSADALKSCHPEAGCWPKDLPEYFRRDFRFLALSRGLGLWQGIDFSRAGSSSEHNFRLCRRLPRSEAERLKKKLFFCRCDLRSTLRPAAAEKRVPPTLIGTTEVDALTQTEVRQRHQHRIPKVARRSRASRNPA